MAKPTTVREEKKAGAESREGEEECGLEQEHKIEVKGELLVFQDKGVKRGGQSRIRELKAAVRSWERCIDWQLGVREDIQLS